MSPFKRGRFYSLYVSDQQGYFQRSTGTTDARLARRMEAMCVELKDTRQWAILSALRANRVTLGEVYDAWGANALETLAARLSAVDLSALLDGWRSWCVAQRQADVRTPNVYWQQVTTLIVPGQPFSASELTPARIIQWLTSRTAASSGTKRKYLYALRSFIQYAMQMGALATNPANGLKAPKKNPARVRWVEEAVDRAIVAASAPRYQAALAFIKGTGADVSAALRAEKGDVDVGRGVVRLRGTKTDRRQVHEALIEPWALAIVAGHAATVLKPHHPLFPGLDRNNVSHHHTDLCRALDIQDYTLKDARHSIAVRMRFKGYTFEQIAEQLGNSPAIVAAIYARFKPTMEQRVAK